MVNFTPVDRCFPGPLNRYQFYSIYAFFLSGQYAYLPLIDESKEHKFTTLKGMSSQLQEEFDTSLQRCYDRITEMCKAEKCVWQELDLFEEKCHKLLTDVTTRKLNLVRYKNGISNRSRL
mgnify:CR=1 FL=1